MFELSDLLVFFLFVFFLMLWWNAQGVKQIALQATKSYCKQAEVQLLDEGVVLRGFWIKRDRTGRLKLWRSYNFEFTATGNDRYVGRVILLGRFVEEVQLEAHRLN